MRKTCGAIAVSILTMALLLPLPVFAGPHTVLGSLTLTKADDTALTNEVTGFAVLTKPGFDRNITQPIPPFTLPIFVDDDRDDAGRILFFRFDTLVVLTNTTGGSVQIKLTVRNAAGDAILGSATRTLDPHATIVVALSSLM